MALLTVNRVTKRFGGLAALEDVSFSVDEGAIHGLIGPNGSGKSTMINAISAIFRPDSGTIAFRGESIEQYAPHRVASSGIARTFQEVQLFADMTVLENAMVGGHRLARAGIFGGICGTGWIAAEERSLQERAREALAFAGLARWRDGLARNLSYGHQRLLEIARALASDPMLMLLDEPAAGLNAGETAALMDLIVRISGRGITVLLVEHNMRLVMNLCRAITVLDHGRRIADGPPSSIQSDPAVIEAYLGAKVAADKSDADGH